MVVGGVLGHDNQLGGVQGWIRSGKRWNAAHFNSLSRKAKGQRCSTHATDGVIVLHMSGPKDPDTTSLRMQY